MLGRNKGGLQDSREKKSMEKCGAKQVVVIEFKRKKISPFCPLKNISFNPNFKAHILCYEERDRKNNKKASKICSCAHIIIRKKWT